MATASTKQMPNYLTKSELPEVIRAVGDHVKSLVDSEISQLSTTLPVQIARSVDKLIADKVDAACNQLRREFEDKLTRFEQTHNASLADLKDWLKALPTPVVDVKPEFHVSVPPLEQPSITVTSPEVVLQVPKLDQPTINFTTPEVIVNVPEQRPPEVRVEVPRRKVRKSIEYDAAGRPVGTIEEDV